MIEYTYCNKYIQKGSHFGGCLQKKKINKYGRLERKAC